MIIASNISLALKTLNFFTEEFELERHSPTVIEALSVKMDFLSIRIDRIKPVSEEEVKNLGTLKTKFDDLQSKAANISVRSDESPEELLHFANPLPRANSSSIVNDQSAQVAGTNNRPLAIMEAKTKVPVWKWNVKFTGDPRSISTSDFVRKANDLGTSRNISDEELFNSAVELFEGVALKWFHSALASQNFNSWRGLCEKLISDFESPLYVNDLLDFIKSRKQSSNESVVVFFAIMEDLFLKLKSKLDVNEQIKILRRNVLPEYFRSLSLHNFTTVDELKEACKRLESTYKYTNRSRVRPEGTGYRILNTIEEPEGFSEPAHNTVEGGRARQPGSNYRYSNTANYDFPRQNDRHYNTSNNTYQRGRSYFSRNSRGNQQHNRANNRTSQNRNQERREERWGHNEERRPVPENFTGTDVSGPATVPRRDQNGPGLASRR